MRWSRTTARATLIFAGLLILAGTALAGSNYLAGSNKTISIDHTGADEATVYRPSVVEFEVAPPTSKLYAVNRGDSLSVIGFKLGVDPLRLCGANALANPNLLSVGQVLRVPPVSETVPDCKPVLSPKTSHGPPSAHYARGDWWALINQYDWPRALAYEVMMCESKGNPNAYNPKFGATGLFQILHGPFDPAANVAMAYQMYRQRGWQPWVASIDCWGD